MCIYIIPYNSFLKEMLASSKRLDGVITWGKVTFHKLKRSQTTKQTELASDPRNPACGNPWKSSPVKDHHPRTFHPNFFSLA